MGVAFNSGRVTADISGNVNVATVGNSAAYTNLKITSRAFSAGTTTDTVPASKLWIVKSATTPYAASNASCRLVKGGANIELTGVTTAALSGMSWSGEIKLAAGDTVNVIYVGTVTYYEIDA